MTRCPQLLQPAGLGHDHEVDIRVFVGVASSQRALQQQRAHPPIALRPAHTGIHDRFLLAGFHHSCIELPRLA
jgi:hypothetical protein